MPEPLRGFPYMSKRTQTHGPMHTNTHSFSLSLSHTLSLSPTKTCPTWAPVALYLSCVCLPTLLCPAICCRSEPHTEQEPELLLTEQLRSFHYRPRHGGSGLSSLEGR